MTNAELIKALRHCGKGGDVAERCLPCGYYDSEPWCEAALANDAADALEAADKRIKELMPKEGEWIDANGADVPLDKDGYATDSCYCSICGDWLTASDEYATRGRYCPNCGARMRKGEIL